MSHHIRLGISTIEQAKRFVASQMISFEESEGEEDWSKYSPEGKMHDWLEFLTKGGRASEHGIVANTYDHAVIQFIDRKFEVAKNLLLARRTADDDKFADWQDSCLTARDTEEYV